MTENIAVPRFRLSRMQPWDSAQLHHSAGMLELFLDLVFVVAVSIASAQLHHALSEAHFVQGVTSYAMVFFAVWWAWKNFTWFATSFDTDDWLYRIATIMQMGGVLVFAAGIRRAFEGDFTIPVVGYVLMRVAMVARIACTGSIAQGGPPVRVRHRGRPVTLDLLPVHPRGSLADRRLRALRAHLDRGAGLRRVPAPEAVASPAHHRALWALRHNRAGREPAGLRPRSSTTSRRLGRSLRSPCLRSWSRPLSGGSYFWPSHHRAIASFGRSLRYGYMHYFVFGAAAAFSAGIGVEIDVFTGKSELSNVVVWFTVKIPIAIFLLGIWWIAIRDNADRVFNTVLPVGALLVLLDLVLPVPVTLTVLIMVVIVVVLVLRPPVARAEAASWVLVTAERGLLVFKSYVHVSPLLAATSPLIRAITDRAHRRARHPPSIIPSRGVARPPQSN